MRAPARGFSLIEVILAVTIAVIAMSMGTLGLAGLSEECKVRSAALALAGALRQSRSQAAALGRPVVLRLHRSQCELLIPRKREGALILESTWRLSLPSSMTVNSTDSQDTHELLQTRDSSAEFWIQPEGAIELDIALRGQCGMNAKAKLNSWTGLEAIVLLESQGGVAR